MSLRRLLNLLSAAILTAALSACLSSKPTTDPTRFYVLSVEPAKASLAKAAGLSLPVYVAPVETPAYLDDSRLVARKQDNELVYSEFHQWAEPVRDGLTRCLREHLAAWLGEGRVHPLERRRPAGDFLEVQASVSRFEASQNGQAVLIVRWRIVQAKTGAVLLAKQTEVMAKAANITQDPDGVVRALSEAVASWSREVAEAVTQMGQALSRADRAPALESP